MQERQCLGAEIKLLREMLEELRTHHERERRAWEEERHGLREEHTFLRTLLVEQSAQVKLLTDERQRKEHERPSLFSWFRRSP